MPLGEDGEAYTLDILANGAVKRTLAAAQPALLYAAADEIVDFGGPQTGLALRIRQISRIAGPGAAFEASVPVRAG